MFENEARESRSGQNFFEIPLSFPAPAHHVGCGEDKAAAQDRAYIKGAFQDRDIKEDS